MKMELIQLADGGVVDPEEKYEARLHDVNAILMDLCIALGDSGLFEFRIDAFGDPAWPVDVRTDLSTVLQQIPAALKACDQKQAFSIDLFEQGVERRLDFEPRGERYEVSCVSLAEWMPEPGHLDFHSGEVAWMLKGLAKKFTDTVVALLPKTGAHPWFLEYIESVS